MEPPVFTLSRLLSAGHRLGQLLCSRNANLTCIADQGAGAAKRGVAQFNLQTPLMFWQVTGLDNLLYSADADFSCFADLALTSPEEYRKPGAGSLLQCVLTPAGAYMPLPNAEIAARVHKQARARAVLGFQELT